MIKKYVVTVLLLKICCLHHIDISKKVEKTAVLSRFFLYS